MKVHQLSKEGLTEYIKKINEARDLKRKEQHEAIFTEMREMASKAAYIHPFPGKKDFVIDPDKEFTTRWELAEYLELVFGNEVIPPSVYNWLTLVYFNQFIKVKRQKYDVGAPENYYTKKQNHRHILSFSHFLYRRFGTLVKPLFLDNDCRSIGDLTDQVWSFTQGRNNKSFYELLNRLYLETTVDEHNTITQQPKPNIVGPLPTKSPKKIGKGHKEKIGNIRALKRFVVQLQETHNLNLLTADDLYNLLPSNFDYYKSSEEDDQ